VRPISFWLFFFHKDKVYELLGVQIKKVMQVQYYFKDLMKGLLPKQAQIISSRWLQKSWMPFSVPLFWRCINWCLMVASILLLVHWQHKHWLEDVNNRSYHIHVYSKYLIMPQETHKLTKVLVEWCKLNSCHFIF
jgi:hypothetical protein